jgi:pimeloyl-ACP methyl ester carboxylesterase
MRPRLKQLFKILIKAATIGVMGLLAAGIVYEKIGERQDRIRYPQIGRSVDIGGRTLNLFCSGEGGPTVIFEAPGHTAGYTWINIQREIAKSTLACWYDRAGYGWSDPGPSPRTFVAVAQDLHALVHAAKLPPPYILVAGGGVGGMHMRVFNGLYPKEVAGAILMGALDMDFEARELKYMKGALSSLPPWAKRAGCKVVFPALLRVGLLRLMGNPGAGRPNTFGKLRPDEWHELMFLSTNASIDRTEGEACSMDENREEVREAGNFGSLPLVLLESSEPSQAPSAEYQKGVEAFNEYWFHQLLPRWAALSTRGRLVLTKDPAAPESVVQAVRDVITEVRAGFPSSGNGSE